MTLPSLAPTEEGGVNWAFILREPCSGLTEKVGIKMLLAASGTTQ